MLINLAALAGYTGLSVLLFGLPVLADPARRYIGSPGDPTHFTWFLTWWPHALARGANPFLTDRVWAPLGYNLAWATSIPGLSLVMSPVTVGVDPVVAYNVLAVLAPPLSAWTAFLLCRRLCGAWRPALVGGWLFGFSTYVLGQLTSHIHMAFAPLVPLAAYLVVRRLDGSLRPAAFVAALAATLVAQFSVSNEVFASLTLFGGAALALGLAVGPAGIRGRVLGLLPLLAAAYLVVAVVLSPYLYFVFAGGMPGRPLHDARVHSADLLNFVVPTPLTLVGGRAFRPIAARFLGNYGESTAYVGLGLIAVIVAYAREQWRRPPGRLLLGLLAVVTVASLGPQLNLLGHSTVSLPWRLVRGLPLLNQALPVRFTLFVFLVVAVVVALWLAGDGAGRRRWALVAVAIVLLVPDVSGSYWRSTTNVPPFFATGQARHELGGDERVLQLPTDNRADGMLWHVKAGLSYPMVGGYVGFVPPAFVRWPIMHTLWTAWPIADAERQFRAFLGAHQVRTIVVGDGSGAAWTPLVASLGVAGVPRDGVTLYRVPDAVGSAYGAGDAAALEQRLRQAQFSFLLTVARRYLEGGGAAVELTPRTLERAGLMPLEWGAYRATGGGADRRFWTQNGLWLGARGEGIGVGVTGAAADVRPVIERYRRHAREVVFPAPLEAPTPQPKDSGLLLMVFDRAGLTAAAGEPW